MPLKLNKLVSPSTKRFIRFYVFLFFDEKFFVTFVPAETQEEMNVKHDQALINLINRFN